ncbi:MAG: hypothetical protein LBG92_09725 [Prevotellaceae bacterium]|jgi:hypothetical protein|nr:hypothetical protein [Prevotellaceae bacterium]
MKLADKYTPEQLPNNSFYDYFSADLRAIIHAVTPDLSTNQMQINEKGVVDYNTDRDFYETTYIPLFSKTKLNLEQLPNPSNCILPDDLKSKLDLIERNILSFVYNGKEAHRYIITGKKGWGKTTLLRFLTAYVIPKLNSICGNRICNPLYISFNTKQADHLTEEDFDKILLNELCKFCATKRNEDIESPFYQYLLKKTELSKEKEEYDFIKKELDLDIITSKEAQKKFFQLKKDILTQKDRLVSYTSLEYFNSTDTDTKIPLLIIDDLDPHPTAIQVHAYETIYDLAHNHKIKVILAMRPRSYECVVQNTEDTIPASFVMSLDKPDFRRYLLSKERKVQTKYRKGVTISNNMTFSVQSMENFFSYYINVLLQGESWKFLADLADGDLRIFNRLLETFLSSGYIKEAEIVNKITELSQSQSQTARESNLHPMWVVYTSIITNNFPTVFGAKHKDPFNHLMNVLCNGKGEINTHLIRLHLLSYFIRLKRTPFTIIKLHTEYSKMTNQNNGWSTEELLISIRRAVGRFAKARVIGNNQRLILDGAEVRNTNKYDNESFYSEELTRFYFYDLLEIYEYFLYMKDDIEFEDNIFEIRDCIEVLHRYDRFEEVIKYLNFLTDKERIFLTGLEPQQRTIYRNNYAPVSGEIMYSELFVKTMIDYATSRRDILERSKTQRNLSDDERESYNNDLERINRIHNSLSDLQSQIRIIHRQFNL